MKILLIPAVLFTLVCLIALVKGGGKKARSSDTTAEPVPVSDTSQPEDRDKPWPFYPRRPLSNPEQVLYFRLIKALPDHIVLAQVQLSRFLGVKRGNDLATWNNRINRMSADFLVCNKDSSVVAVIELDDKSHQREDRKQADAKKDKAVTDAGIRIVRWKSIPDEQTIRMDILLISAVETPAPIDPVSEQTAQMEPTE